MALRVKEHDCFHSIKQGDFMKNKELKKKLIEKRDSLLESLNKPHNKDIKRTLVGEIIAYQNVINML